MKLDRRLFLRGLGGAVIALPILECFRPKSVSAQAITVPPYAIFFRQANGCAAQQTTDEVGAEPERFWPSAEGALTPASMGGRAVDELSDYASKLLIVGNVNKNRFDYGDGHASGVMQSLTARGPVVAGAAGDSEANGESIDNRIGRELNSDGRDSMYFYAGRNSGWLGGACSSYRGPGQRRAAISDPWEAYQNMVGLSGGVAVEEAQRIARRKKSVNDLVREQLKSLEARPELSTRDRQRLDLHFTAIRDLEVQLGCRLAADQERILETGSAVYESNNGEDIIATVRLQMTVAALAVACGYTRSVAIQPGNGNDGNTRFLDPDTNQRLENYHYISHRRTSHGEGGEVIPGSDLLHHKIDRYFGQMFAHLLKELDSYPLDGGRTMLDMGMAIWHNDNGNGPGHSMRNCPWIIGGSAGGFLKQGQYIRLSGGTSAVNHSQLLNTIGTAAGLKNASGGPLDDFGDPNLPRGLLPDIVV